MTVDTLRADFLTDALSAVQQRKLQAGFEETVPSCYADQHGHASHRGNFLAICDNYDIYDAMRSLIHHADYWRQEEQHFQRINEVVQDYNERKEQRRMTLAELSCPPVTVLTSLLDKLHQPSRPCKAHWLLIVHVVD